MQWFAAVAGFLEHIELAVVPTLVETANTRNLFITVVTVPSTEYSPLLTPLGHHVAHALGIDVGGSGIKGALVDTATGSVVSERLRVPSPAEFTVENVVQAIAELAWEVGAFDVAGIGFPSVILEGVVSSPPTTFRHEGWLGTDLTKELSRVLEVPCATVNDADAVALAEAAFGVAVGVQGTVLVCTLGTGIGSGLLSGGRLVPNIEVGGLFLPGHHTNVEKWASSRVRSVEDLSWKEWCDRLNDLFTYLEQIFAPDLIVIGGGVSKKHEKFMKYLNVSCPIAPSTFKNDAGIVGAALLARTVNQ